MVGWHHRCNGHELGQTQGDGEGQGGVASCNPQGCNESDTSTLKNNIEKLLHISTYSKCLKSYLKDYPAPSLLILYSTSSPYLCLRFLLFSYVQKKDGKPYGFSVLKEINQWLKFGRYAATEEDSVASSEAASEAPSSVGSSVGSSVESPPASSVSLSVLASVSTSSTEI